MNRQRVLLIAALGITLLLASFAATGASTTNVNDPAYWEAQGYGTCMKTEGPPTPYVLGEPPSGMVWTALVIKAGSESSTETPVFLIENPSPGSYVHPSGKDISYVITCHDDQPHGSTSSTSSSTSSSSTTVASSSTTTTGPTSSTTGPTSSTSSSTSSSTTAAPTSTSEPSTSSPTTGTSITTPTTEPTVTPAASTSTVPGVFVAGAEQERGVLAFTGSTASMLLALAGLLILVGLGIWGVAGRLRHESGSPS